MNITKDIKYIISAILILIIEFTFGKYIEVLGAVPMLTLCFCILVSAFEKELSYSLTLSIILGLVFDVLQGHGFCTYLISFSLSSLATYNFRDSIFSSKSLFIIFDVFVLTIVIQIFYRIMHISDIGKIGFFCSFYSIILPTGIYNTFICLVLYPIFKKIYKR